ncbi:MAG TPA: AAA family ATPase, partial [bacterium]|nr:AAA family ATPase [bacterium]
MLQSLRITNLAIVDDLTVELDRGFTVLSGETGAGKSILVDAINLILGGRASADLVRTGEDAATVEAVFVLDAATRIAAESLGVVFDEHEGEPAELLVKRVVARTGKGRVFLNGGPATLSMLESLGRRLIDIAGQHEHQTLLEPASHRAAVDAAGEHAPILARMGEAFERYATRKREADELATKETDRARREDYLRFQVEELRTAALRDGEEEELLRERQRLAHAEALEEALTRAEETLYSGESAVAVLLKGAHGQLQAAAKIDATLAAHLAALEGARLEVEEVARALRDYRRAEADPDRLEEIEDRLALLDRLRKKHGAKDTAALLVLQASLEADLAELSSLEASLAARRAEEAQALAASKEIAEELSRARLKTGTALAKQVARELAALGMANARFEVAVRPGTLGAFGADDVEFLISPNPGEELKALARTASGGELSRVMLAIKCIVAK